MKSAKCVNQRIAALLMRCGICLLAGCSNSMDVQTASTSQLKSRRSEINRMIAADDFGVSWGVSRWISHATEKNKILKEKEQIDAELQRRRRSGRENVAITTRPPPAETATASPIPNVAEPTSGDTSTTAPSASTKPVSAQQFPTAKPVPNKPGLVFSPSNPSQYVDVSGYPSGSKVKDPYSGIIFTVP
jgi:hypothetical protein